MCVKSEGLEPSPGGAPMPVPFVHNAGLRCVETTQYGERPAPGEAERETAGRHKKASSAPEWNGNGIRTSRT